MKIQRKELKLHKITLVRWDRAEICNIYAIIVPGEEDRETKQNY